MITDAQGTLLAVHCTAANVRDEQAVPTLLAKLHSLQLSVASLHADAGYGFAHTFQQVREAGIEPVLARRNQPRRRHEQTTHGSGLGAIRWVVEQTLAHLGHCRRLKLRYERLDTHFQAFHDLAAALLCFKRLQHYRSGL